jgi:tetratricopeptide (TPR) repeat protein
LCARRAPQRVGELAPHPLGPLVPLAPTATLRPRHASSPAPRAPASRQSRAYAQAKQCYRRAAQRAPPGRCPPRALSRLADCFLRSGDAAFAADAFESAAAAAPSAAAWLGAAAARVRLRDFAAADAALAAASRRDARHPGVWGRLALLELEQGREEEAAKVGGWGRRCFGRRKSGAASLSFSKGGVLAGPWPR